MFHEYLAAQVTPRFKNYSKKGTHI